jgi:hypothetical protein
MREFKTKNFRVVADAIEEDDLDLSWDETGETRKGLESGRFIAFVARVRVFFRGNEVGTDYLGNCIYKSFDDFMDHRECGRQNRETHRREGKFQIYRKNRPHEHCLSKSDKLKPRGFATEARAKQWAEKNAKEEYQIFETGKCGSYFHDMVREAISEARKNVIDFQDARVRRVA